MLSRYCCLDIALLCKFTFLYNKKKSCMCTVCIHVCGLLYGHNIALLAHTLKSGLCDISHSHNVAREGGGGVFESTISELHTVVQSCLWCRQDVKKFLSLLPSVSSVQPMCNISDKDYIHLKIWWLWPPIRADGVILLGCGWAHHRNNSWLLSWHTVTCVFWQLLM